MTREEWVIKNKINTEAFEIITWPESQVFVGHPDAVLIDDDEGFKLFGSSAYIIPVDAKPMYDFEEDV